MTPIRIMFTEGPGALWEWIKDQAEEVKNKIVEAASQWLVTQVITQAAVKLASMFTPVGAFVQAVLMMYNTIMFFVSKIQEIFAWVKSVTSSLATIAKGAIGAAVEYIDGAMSKSIPLIIDFLARLVGVSGIGEQIRGVVSKLQAPVEKAIDTVIGSLVSGAKAAWGGVKTGAIAVKNAVVGWWEAKESFTDVVGASHTLFIQREGDRHHVIVASAVRKYENFLAQIEAQYRHSPDANKRETYERAKFAYELLTRRIERLEAKGRSEKDQAELPELKDLALKSQSLMVETNGEQTSTLEWVHLALDGAGMVPALGIVPDAVNTGLYLIEGDWVNAGISAVAMIPFLGEGATATKQGVRVSKEALERVRKDGLEQELKNAKHLAGKKSATTSLGQSIESLKESIRTGSGPWRRRSAHVDTPVSKHAGATLSKAQWQGTTNIEEVYVHSETNEKLVRHRIMKGEETIKESYRPYSKFGVDPPYPPKPEKAFAPEPEIVYKQRSDSPVVTVHDSKSADGIESEFSNSWGKLQRKAEMPQQRQSDNGFRSQSKRDGDQEVILVEGRVTSATSRNPEATRVLAKKKGEDATHAIGVQAGEDLPQAITRAPRGLNRGPLKAYESEVKAVQIRAAEMGVEVDTHVMLHVKHVMIDGNQVPLLVRIERTDALRKVGTDQFIGEMHFVADIDSETRAFSVRKNIRRL